MLAAGHPVICGLSARADAGSDRRGRLPGRGAFCRGGRFASPEAQGKPCLIGNCQAGWQMMMMSAIRPDLSDPIMLAGSPLSYWAGVHGKNPMRYLGGLLGGTWLTALAAISATEYLTARTWSPISSRCIPTIRTGRKSITVLRISTPRRRASSNREMVGQSGAAHGGRDAVIADDLFVGNKLAPGELQTSTGVRVDLRNIRSPDHRVLFLGRRHHAAAAGPGLGSSIFTITRTRSSRPGRPSSIACIRASVISAYSSPARWRQRNTANLRRRRT